MKLRIYKRNNLYYIQRRIFHFLLIEWWINYDNYGSFSTTEEAKHEIDNIRQAKINKRYAEEGKEILRFTV